MHGAAAAGKARESAEMKAFRGCGRNPPPGLSASPPASALRWRRPPSVHHVRHQAAQFLPAQGAGVLAHWALSHWVLAYGALALRAQAGLAPAYHCYCHSIPGRGVRASFCFLFLCFV
jgi:hypothetical protein